MNEPAEVQVACAVAREAGALIMQYTGGGPVAVEWKAGDEPVTAADRAASAHCVARLCAAFPGDAILSEEREDDGRWRSAPRTWMIDPIDGTKDFIAGRPGFAVMIGLLSAGAPVAGVVYQPLSQEIYYAVLGQGAFWQGPGQAPRRLHVSDVAELAAARMVSSASHPSAKVAALRERAGIRDEVQIGSVGIKLCLIAAGDRDLYVNPAGRTKLWDTCAPHVILAEAGGTLTDTRGQPLSYGPDLAHLHGLVGSNGLVHQAALERLRPLMGHGPLPVS